MPSCCASPYCARSCRRHQTHRGIEIMKTFNVAPAVMAALIAAAFAGTARAEIKNYEFQLVQPTVKAGAVRRHRDVSEFISAANAADINSPIYYQNPDGKPFYSSTPKKTPDNRDYRAVPASADISFDEPGSPREMNAAETKGDRKIKYYRNPMGLPDTSPT